MRYIVYGKEKATDTHACDVVVVGAGLAGLYASLNIDKTLSVLLITKDSIDCSSSLMAQAGIAAALSDDDSPGLHIKDTINAGAGMCDFDAVSVLVNEGPSDIKALSKLNVPFDINDDGGFMFAFEGGHSKKRVVHAGGDATGRDTIKALLSVVSKQDNISFCTNTCLYDIVVENGSVSGVVAGTRTGEFHHIKTNAVILATGGVGQVFRSSTNPIDATGDGIAAAIRAGAYVKDMEFVQFHPTGLYINQHRGSVLLISEALRGEGGLLVSRDGRHFMRKVHEKAELAPRDIVSLGIENELRQSGEDFVYLDITSKSQDYLSSRFPTIYNECLSHNINIASDMIPVRPVQHYIMGGIKTDLYGRTNIAGLYACGESACTGVHGANRLASNSLLECLVFGRRAAEDINKHKYPISAKGCALGSATVIDSGRQVNQTIARIRNAVQDLMTEHCGVIRNARGLTFAHNEITRLKEQLENSPDDSIEYLETLNIVAVAEAILAAAMKRKKSIGAHYIE